MVIAFAHIEKTAGLALRRILRCTYGLRHLDVHPWRQASRVFSADDFRVLQRFYPGVESLAGHFIRPYSDLDQVIPDIQYYTFLRDPVRRTASQYQYYRFKGGKESFDEWIRHDYNRDRQIKKLAGSDDLEAAARLLKERFLFVGLLERYEESLVILRWKTRGRLKISKRRENEARKNFVEIKNELLADPVTRAQLEDANKVDLQLYEYVRNEVYPAQQCEYGDSLAADVEAFRREKDPAPNNLNLLLNRLKWNAFYRPSLALYRQFVEGPCNLPREFQ